jgi:signal transduction histidine kinase/DNA-binding response OmpR family regulator
MKNGRSIEAGSAILRSPLTAIIFTTAAVLVALSMAVTFRAGHVSIEAQRRMNNQLRVISELQELESTVKDAETGQRGYLLTGEESYLEPYTKSITELKTRLDALEELVSQDEIRKEDMDHVSALISEKMGELAVTIRLRKESGLPAAMERVRTNQGKEVMDEIRSNVNRMVETGRSSYDDAVRRADRTSYWRNIIYVGVAVVNLVFLAWAFRRISRQEWLQFGEARLNEQLAGDQNLLQLSEKAIRFLAEYLGAQVGAIAVEEGNYFRQSGTYALSAAHNLNQKFAPGEGLAGQAVKDKRAFVINSVPEGYLAISSGLGHSRPKKLLIAPMKVDGVVNAVIELGFFQPTHRAAIDLVERVSESVGIALRSAKYRTRLQELLEETQRQSEELQTQSEELRVSNEELEEQSRALKESQVRLEQQKVELEQSNSQLEEQTQLLENQKDDLSRAKSELEKQAAIVEQASRYKSDFLANMSHELRTPLNSSLILAKLLADNREGNLTSEQVKYAQTIQSAGNDLLNLINDVLDLAKVEAGHMDINAEPFPVADLLESLTGMFEPLATDKGLTLKTSVTSDVPATLEADRRRLEQVLKNLLSNAVKFTEQGEVSLEIRTAPGDCFAFDVRDTGIGIAEHQQSIIFEPFRQADGTTDRKYGGTGLGLSISRELVRLMGGNIQLSSKPGKGSVFTIILPKRPTAPKRPSARRISLEREPAAVESSAAEKKTALAVPKRSNIPDDREQLKGGSYIILIVEDDESFARILLELAHELDFQVLVATSAEEALALAQQFKPSAIVLDIGLPDNSGMFVLERLKSDSRTRHIPVHVVSGSDYSTPALSMGAVGYMLKPVKREQLVEAFQKLEHRLTQKLRRVLVVEDDPVQLDSLRKLLGSRDVETTGVQTATDCLEKLKNATFDCMVLDLSLPDASGFSLLETLSAEESYSFPPVIIYTGRELSADEEQRLRKYSKSIIIKGAKSPERLLDEVTLFLHQVVSDLPAEQQRMLEHARNREAALEGSRILVAEDDIRNIFALTSLLEPKGVKVQIARNGREALQALEKMEKDPAQRIDLVLMDIMMPEMNGFTAMREIRKNPKWESLPIIALTAKAMRDDQEQCIRAGANDYLAKPLDVEKLLSLIRVWMPR